MKCSASRDIGKSSARGRFCVRGLIGVGMLVMSGGCEQRPPPLRTVVGVIRNDIGLEKDIVVDGVPIGKVSSIIYGDFDPSDGMEIAVVGSSTALILTMEFSEIRRVEFGNGAEVLVRNAIDLNADGIPEYLSMNRVCVDRDELRCIKWRDQLVLRDQTGAVISRIDAGAASENSRVPTVTWGDLDGKPGDEIVVEVFRPGRDGLFTGVMAVDSTGTVMWESYVDTINSVYPVIVGSPDGSAGTVVVVHRVILLTFESPDPRPASRTVLDASGQPLQEDRIEFPNPFVSVSRFPTHRDGYHFVSVDPPSGIYDLNGDVAVALDFPEPIGSHNNALPQFDRVRNVTFTGQEDAHTVLVSRFVYDTDWSSLTGTLLPRTEVTIYDPDSTRVYHEILGDSLGGVAVVPAVDGDGQFLLVGTVNRVYRYRVIGGGDDE